MAVAFDAFSNVAAGTGNLSWTHTPVGTPRGVRVDIVENGGTNGVTGVTYGGVALELVAVNAKTSGEAGTVITYFLGVNIPAGAQTVSVTVSDAVSKRAGAMTVTAATDTCCISADLSIGSDSIVNPSSTLNLLGKTCFVSLALHSGQGAATGITQLTGWTNRLEHDFGAQMGAWYTYNTISTANVACGWTQTADDAVMVAAAITEAPLTADSTAVQLTESASIEVVFDSRTLPIKIVESASVAVLTVVSATDAVAVQASEGFSSIGLVLSASDTSTVQLSETAVMATLTAQQAMPVHLADTASVTAVGVAVTDSAALQASESATLDSSIPFFTVGETSLVGLGDARATVVTETGALVVATTDTLATLASDNVANLFVYIPGSVQNFVVSDAFRVALNGSGSSPISITASESLRTVIDEPATQDSAIGVRDTVVTQSADVGSANTGSPTSFFTVSDSVRAQGIDNSSLISNTILTVVDSLRVQVPEDVPDVATVLVASESVRVVVSEPTGQSTNLGVSDGLTVQGAGEVGQIGGMLPFFVTDTLAVQVPTEVPALSPVVVVASESLRCIASETLVASSSVSAGETLRAVSVELITAFKGFSVTDDVVVRIVEQAAPIFNDFVAIPTADTCAVQAAETVPELVSYLLQLSVSDALATPVEAVLREQFAAAVASDVITLGCPAEPALFSTQAITDSLAAGTIEIGIAIPRVSVNVSVFTDDMLLGSTDGQASVSIVYEAIEKVVSDGCRISGEDEPLLQPGYFTSEDCLVGVSASSVQEVVPNATPETWNGNMATEHRHDKPKPWKYILSDKLNW